MVGLLLLVMSLQQLEWAQAWDALQAASLYAVPALALWHLGVVLIDAYAWRALCPHALAVAPAVAWRWIAESVNTLLPVAQIGGDVVRARLWHRAGHPAQAAALVVGLDVLATALAQLPFALLGVFLYAEFVPTANSWHLPDINFDVGFGISADVWVGVLALVGGLLALSAAGVVLWRVRRPEIAPNWIRCSKTQQSLHSFALACTRLMSQLLAQVKSVGWRRFAHSSALHFIGWVAGAVEIWLGLRLLGFPVSFVTALMFESLLQTARSFAFLIPAGVGVQEVTMLALANVFGVPVTAMLALALLKRGREALLSVPGMCALLVMEWHYRRARPDNS